MKVARVLTLFLPELSGKRRHPAGADVAFMKKWMLSGFFRNQREFSRNTRENH
jgi:hypothetical protein